MTSAFINEMIAAAFINEMISAPLGVCTRWHHRHRRRFCEACITRLSWGNLDVQRSASHLLPCHVHFQACTRLKSKQENNFNAHRVQQAP